MPRLLALLINAFPFWVLALCATAMVQPLWFTWFNGPWIVWTLAVIMLGMGLTLTFDDFRRIVQMPRPVALGFLAQFTIMPLLAWGTATILKLDTPFAVGLILVGSCPGGTASNLVTFLARGDVALSVVMTTCSTIAAVIMSTLLTQLVATADVMDRARELAADIVRAAPLSIAAIMQTVRETEGMALAAAFTHLRSGAVGAYSRMLESEDAREGPKAFAEKREPLWKGR
jgi:BASS family bile acid:Na+ symporter